jgi:hypothetical protein
LETPPGQLPGGVSSDSGYCVKLGSRELAATLTELVEDREAEPAEG